MRTLLGMQYGGNIQQQYPRRQLQLQPQSFQEGGGVPSAYKTSFGFDSPISPALASLMRGEKKREAFEEARTAELSEMQKQKRSGLFGSIGGLGGGLLASTALGALGFTPAGIPLALAAGLGTGLGKAFGSKVGYEGGYEPGVMFRKAKSEKAKDMMYGKQAGLEDIERAGRDYTAGIDTAAGVAGLKAGLTAGFAPEGGVYGKAGKFGRGLRATDVATASQLALPTATESALQAGKQMTEEGIKEGAGLTFGRTTNPFALSPEQGSQFLSPRGNILDLTQKGQGFIPSAVSDVGAGALLEGGAEALSGGAEALTGGSGSFGQAFANAREAGKEIFEWNGKMYNTVLAQSGGMIRQNPQSLLGYLG